MIINSLNELLGNLLDLKVVREFPRHSVRFAKNFFRGKPIVAVEIGSYKGRNAVSILKELNVEKLYIVDPYEEYDKYKDRELDKDDITLSKAYNEARKRLRKYSSKVIFIRKFSHDAVSMIPEADFIYIDGNHDYEFVKKDVQDYLPKLKKKGILAGHDITNKSFNKDILKVLIEFYNKKKILPTISRTDWWIVQDDN